MPRIPEEKIDRLKQIVSLVTLAEASGVVLKPQGSSLFITRDPNGGRITAIGTPQRFVTFTYGANGYIDALTDPLGRTVRYTYTPQQRLATVTDPDGGVTRYSYQDDSEFPATAACPSVAGGIRLSSTLRPGKTTPLTQHYGPGKRVLKETLADGTELHFRYQLVGACVTHVAHPDVRYSGQGVPIEDTWENFTAGWRISGGVITATTVVDSQGHSTTQRFNAGGLGTQQTDARGQVIRYQRDAANRLTAVTDALGRTTRYQYDARGNHTQILDALNRRTDITYDAAWNTVTSVTRYLEPAAQAGGTPVTHSYQYHPQTGVLLKSTDPLGHSTTYTYTAQGQLESRTDPLGHTTTLSYNNAGDLIKVTDALGNTTQLTPDAAGRLTEATDPLGHRTQTRYNGIDQTTEVTDALSGKTTLTYDSAQRLQSLTDPLQHALETYTYDDQDRITQVTDALGQSEHDQYDAASRLTRFADRRGQATHYTYDAQDRLTKLTYPDGATQTRTYDALGRLTELTEGAERHTYTYDSVDRLTQERTTSPTLNYTVAYAYDALDRRTQRTLTVGTHSPDVTTYTYDNASRLTAITYKTQTTRYQWDAAGRLTSKTLPNGITQSYTYDAADRVLSITYQKTDGTLIESLAYTYDANGNRITKTQSLTPSRPETPIQASYDTANRLSQLTLTASGQTYALSYDANGALSQKQNTQDPTDTTLYTWDVRNRLSAISAPGLSASFTYDALDRRTDTTVNGHTVHYLYDGAQAIAELRDGQLSATLLTGLGIDDVIARYTQSGEHTYLTDALGSVMAQAQTATPTVLNTYGYSPFGEVNASAADDNPYQYTARENDGTGLYYYRARYYDPVLKRFISSDPIGLAGGLNTYSYVGNSPLNFVDPYGLFELPTIPQPVVDAAAGFGDTASFGITNAIRDALGINDAVDQSSGAYTGGEIAGGVCSGGAGALRGAAAFGGTRLGNSLLNSNRYLRIGPGRMPANGPFPASPNAPRISIGPGPNNPHIDLRIRGID